MSNPTDKFDRGLIVSVVFHGLLVLTAISAPTLFPSRSDARWGSNTGGDGGIDVKIVGSMTGVPLPAPEVVNDAAAANESKGFYNTETAPEPPPTPDEAEPIPETKAPVKTTPKPAPARPVTKARTDEVPPAPPNAVPYGQGGRPAISYGQFSTGAGSAGVAVGDGVFGSQYGYYVDAMTRKISQNWLQSLVDNRTQRAPRVYLTFEIQRNGAITGIEVKQSSGIPSLDRSAQRAILASNPLSPLPAGYRGQSVTVSFYFEYAR
jgi:TonB family protein